MTEHRRFIRIVYNSPATISQQKQQWQSEIRDLSLHGLLLIRPKEWKPVHNNMYNVAFSLQDSDIVLQMETELVHYCDDYLRMQIAHIDIDSISHLKRLVELNVGNDEFLHRELEQLSDLHNH
ncbi:PilZ domain-containing protein [Thaumasiovibrio subtropicus]|uniref:PilZ domain-containing protein n=1 Tax=Thaumasiovibrio subtropicus TaxID=1891207 RepID=UPI000B3553A7|nr:PilZ domain-containing protein [Thaumasiovibrio subtropicus]